MKDEEVIIEFKNNVQDINKNELKLLFNRFYMKDRSRSNDSSGLGLTITEFLIDSMDGEINVEMDEDWLIFNIKFQEVLN